MEKVLLLAIVPILLAFLQPALGQRPAPSPLPEGPGKDLVRESLFFVSHDRVHNSRGRIQHTGGMAPGDGDDDRSA